MLSKEGVLKKTRDWLSMHENVLVLRKCFLLYAFKRVTFDLVLWYVKFIIWKKTGSLGKFYYAS